MKCMFDAIYKIVVPGYHHHQAFDEVALGLQGAFAELGHRVPIVTHAVENSLVLGANIAPQYVPQSATIFNLEVLSSAWATDAYLTAIDSHATWDYAQDNIKYLQLHGFAAQLCPLGFHECLRRIQPLRYAERKFEIDVLFYGSIFGRRIPILNAIEKTGLKTKWLFNVYGKERDEHIAKSRVVLNIHAYEISPPETPRLSYLYANEACVVSEHETPVAAIPDLLRKLVDDGDLAKAKAEDNCRIFKQTRQAEYIKRLLQGGSNENLPQHDRKTRGSRYPSLSRLRETFS